MDYPEYIDRLEIVGEIVKRTRPKYEKEGDWRDKINKRIKYGIKISQIATNTKEQVRFLDVSEYAKQKFPGKFDDWTSAPGIAIIHCSGFKFGGSGRAYSIPETIGECHQHIKELSHKLFDAWDKIRELEAENERLRPDAEHRRKVREQNKINGKKPKSPKNS